MRYMKKLLYIVSTLKRSGPTSQLFNIIKYLDRTRFEPHLVTLSPEPADSRWADYETLGVQLYSMNLSRLSGIFFGKSKLKSLISQLQPDLIHTQGIRGDMLSASLPLDIPRICTIRNIPQQDYPMTYNRLVAALMLWRHVRAMRRLNICVGVSKAVCENLQQSFGLKNATTIQNGVDTEFYYPAPLQEKLDLRKQLGLPVDGRLWISSGHLSARKDPLFLIEAWKCVFGTGDGDHLIFIGSGTLEGECKNAAEGCKNIHVLGRVANVSEFLKASDYLVSASKAEGMPNAVLEAMACGLSVVLSDIGPHREIWEMAPNIGQLFELGSQVSLKHALVDLAQYVSSTHSESALSLISESFSAAVMSKNYQASYNKLIEGSLY